MVMMWRRKVTRQDKRREIQGWTDEKWEDVGELLLLWRELAFPVMQVKNGYGFCNVLLKMNKGKIQKLKHTHTHI